MYCIILNGSSGRLFIKYITRKLRACMSWGVDKKNTHIRGLAVGVCVVGVCMQEGGVCVCVACVCGCVCGVCVCVC